ncbi:unnamed protein product, partial [Polarella glacialis]
AVFDAMQGEDGSGITLSDWISRFSWDPILVGTNDVIQITDDSNETTKQQTNHDKKCDLEHAQDPMQAATEVQRALEKWASQMSNASRVTEHSCKLCWLFLLLLLLWLLLLLLLLLVFFS